VLLTSGPNDWCCYSFSWWACWASLPLTLVVSCLLQTVLLLWFALKLSLILMLLMLLKYVSYLLQNKEYLKAISKFSLFSCYVLIYKHFGENRVTLWHTVAMFWCNKPCAVFLDHPVLSPCTLHHFTSEAQMTDMCKHYIMHAIQCCTASTNNA